MIKIHLIRRGYRKPFKTVSREEVSANEIHAIVKRNKMGFFKVRQGGRNISPRKLQSNLDTYITGGWTPEEVNNASN